MKNQIFHGEVQLKEHAKKFTRRVEKINDQIYFFAGFGGSNMILIIGEENCVLIDTLNGEQVAKDAYEELRKITDKPIETIIYTYTHFDHTGGAGVFADEKTEIIAHEFETDIYGYSHLLKDINKKRGMRQFGPTLSQEESICVGIWNKPFSKTVIREPNHLIEGHKNVIERAGLELHLISVPGETDDHLFVWIPKYAILCCGDNYYESWPNLYAIRGSQYRDISSWIDSLTTMLEYPTQILIPGHTAVINGEAKIKEILTNYRDAIEYVLVETLKGMNQGLTPDELVESVTLPQQYAQLPYLQEYYGTVEWTIRAIFSGYLGWFDGNPTHLCHLPLKERASKMIRMMNGRDAIIAEIDHSLECGEYQWAVELCDILLNDQPSIEIKKKKAEALIALGRQQLSANGRHYYLVCAKELLADTQDIKQDI